MAENALAGAEVNDAPLFSVNRGVLNELLAVAVPRVCSYSEAWNAAFVVSALPLWVNLPEAVTAPLATRLVLLFRVMLAALSGPEAVYTGLVVRYERLKANAPTPVIVVRAES